MCRVAAAAASLTRHSKAIAAPLACLVRRTDSYDETAEGAHYISKRGGGGGDTATPPSEEQALAATQARIDRLKLAEDKHAAAAAESEFPGEARL
jgi:hypothetical protein